MGSLSRFEIGAATSRCRRFSIVEIRMRKQRAVLSADDRNERHRQIAERRAAEAAEAEAALEDKVRRNIALYGP